MVCVFLLYRVLACFGSSNFRPPIKIVALVVKISSENFVECTGKWTADVRLGIRGKDVIPAKMKGDVKFPS